MHKASISCLCRSHYAPEQIEAWAGPKRPEHYERLIRDVIVFVMEESDDIAGFGALDSAAADIRALYVAPEAVGRGVGAAQRRIGRDGRAYGCGRRRDFDGPRPACGAPPAFPHLN